jgi:hypothetical protein
MRSARRALVAIAALLCAACSSPSVEPMPVGIYSEFLAPADVEPSLPVLASHHAALSIATADAQIGDANLAHLLRAAEAAGVEVRIWLVLDRASGYWPNESNIDLYDAAVVRLLDWLSAEDLTASTIVFDVEPAYAYSEELRTTLSGTDLTAIVGLLRSHHDPIAFEAARTAFDATIARVHAAGLRAECVTYPQVIDDLADHDADVQDALDLPVDGLAWDEITLMVYQTGFSEQAHGAWLGPGLVGSYATDAATAWGERSTIALGLVGTAGIFVPEGPVYTDPEVLRLDVAAARAGGAARVEMYSLDGMLTLGGPGPWLDATVAAPMAATPSSTVRTARSLARALDAMLNTP